jgi:hypothetical protein
MGDAPKKAGRQSGEQMAGSSDRCRGRKHAGCRTAAAVTWLLNRSIRTHILAREESLVGVLELPGLPKAAAAASPAPTPADTAPLLLRHLGDRHPLLVLQAGVQGRM